jgi:hypothetical protein
MASNKTAHYFFLWFKKHTYVIMWTFDPRVLLSMASRGWPKVSTVGHTSLSSPLLADALQATMCRLVVVLSEFRRPQRGWWFHGHIHVCSLHLLVLLFPCGAGALDTRWEWKGPPLLGGSIDIGCGVLWIYFCCRVPVHHHGASRWSAASSSANVPLLTLFVAAHATVSSSIG